MFGETERERERVSAVLFVGYVCFGFSSVFHSVLLSNDFTWLNVICTNLFLDETTNSPLIPLCLWLSALSLRWLPILMAAFSHCGLESLIECHQFPLWFKCNLFSIYLLPESRQFVSCVSARVFFFIRNSVQWSTGCTRKNTCKIHI